MISISTETVPEKITAVFPPCLTFDILETGPNAIPKIEARYIQVRDALKTEEGVEVFHEPIRTYLPDGSSTLSYRKKVHVRYRNGSLEFEPLKQIISKYIKAYFKIVT